MTLGIIIGHSPKSKGRVTPYISEYELNKELSFAIAQECDNRNISNIVIHRENGYSKLPADINKLNPEYCISVHHNGFDDSSVNGTETLYYHKSKTSRKFARFVNNKMVEALGYRNRDTHGVNSENRGGYLLKYTAMPCILIEPYFTTNIEAVEERNPEVLAKAIVDGFESFLDNA